MTDKTFYPSKIKGTTGRNKANNIQTQEIINVQNLYSGNTSLASWGEYTPSKCNSSNPIRWWCNTLTTKSGSYDHPEEIYVDAWNINSSIPDDMVIKSFKVEYAYALAKYSGWGSPQIQTKPTFTLKKSGKKISSATGVLPKVVSNTKTGSFTNHPITFSSYPQTIGDLRKTKLYIKCGGNTASEIGRLLMQYVRVVVKYEDPNPKYTISLGKNITQKINTTYTCTCTIGNSNSYSKDSICYIQIPTDTTITNAKFDGKKISLKVNKTVAGKYTTYQYTISKKGSITFDLKHSTTGVKTIKAWLSKYCSTTAEKKVTVTKTSVDFDFTPQLYQNNTWQDITTNDTTVYDDDGAKIRFKCKIKRDAVTEGQESIYISAEDLITSWATEHATIHFTKNTNNEWTINQKFPATTNYIEYISAAVDLTKADVYNIVAKYDDTETDIKITKNYSVKVLSHPLKKENFKIRLEDGTDVQYNSLSFSRGDDLTIPLVYTTEDVSPIKDSEMMINGETKRIPLDEVQYVKFDISIEKENTNLTDVLTYIDIYDAETGENCSSILKDISDNAVLLESDEKKYCIIKNLSSEEHTILKLAVESDTIRECIIKIKPYNYDLYDTKWNPSNVLFDDYPNVKIYIKGENDIRSQDTLTLYYYIENQSDIDGYNLRFQLKEPASFEKLTVNHSDKLSFNPNTRIITIPFLSAHSEQYIIEAQYKATKKGYYDFIISTLDDPNTVNDDQVPNSYTHNVMVDIVSEVKVTTTISNTKPYVGDLIDFEIDFRNYYKPQKEFTFNISDIGDYNPIHNSNDYTVKRVDCEDGTFTESTDSSTNKIGTWIIENVETDKDYKLILTLEPNATGVHVIKTQFLDSLGSEKTLTNRVKVIEKSKEIGFNVYHAIGDENTDCSDIDKLTPICDDDFITLSDSIYYVFEITNNNRAPVNQPVNIYARLPSSFLENGILCSSIDNYVIDEASNLVSLSLDKLEGCETKQTTKIAIKVKPNQTGKYVSNFMLSTKNSKVLYKQLKLTVDSEFDKKELEHEITIYNFEKTNRYYRYEIDNNGEIFKFFNKGDKTVRPIQIEDYDKSAVETYRGTNLKDIVRQIQDKSQYVEPEFLRIGANKLKDKGYELYPDGFIRRFGLLNSEVFHETGQLPIISNLGDRVMKWNIDDWNSKVWAGDRYGNGMFDLAVEYDKVPTNFSFHDIENRTARLQHIVDETKPYGSKAFCYDLIQSEIDLQLNVKDVLSEMHYTTPIDLKIDDINTLITKYRDDNTILYCHDDIYVDLNLNTHLSSEYDLNTLKHYTNDEEDYIEDPNDSMAMDIETQLLLYDDITYKRYINECFDIIKNIYYNDNQNIDIIMPYTELPTTTTPTFATLNKSQILNYVNNHLLNELIGYEITYKDNKIEFGYIEKKDFKGFMVINNDEIVSQRYIDEDVATFNIQAQTIDVDDSNKIVHFWGRVNDGDYYHIGFVELGHLSVSTVNRTRSGDANVTSLSYIPEITATHTNDVTYSWTLKQEPIVFKISDRKQIIHETFDYIKEVDSGKWSGLMSVNNGKYAQFDYKSNIDPECSDTSMDVPKILLKYNDINIDRLSEITDIQFKIKAQSNKDNFMNDLKINVLKDGDYYVPNDGFLRKVYYPSNISNNKKELLNHIIIHQPNMTICSDCLKTSLGYYDECKYCHSTNVTHYDKTQPVTLCYQCGRVTNGTYNYCKHCLSNVVENLEVDYNKTYCQHCGALSDDYYKYCPHCFSKNTIYLDNKRQVYQLSDASKQNIDPIIINTDEESVNILNATLPFNEDTVKDLTKLLLNIHVTNNNDGKYYYCPNCKHGGVGNFDICPYCHGKDVNNYQAQQPTFRAYLKIDNNFSLIDLSPINSIPYGETVKTLQLHDIMKNITNENCMLMLYVDNSGWNMNLNQILSLPINDKYIEKILKAINKIDVKISNLSLDYEFTDNKDWIGLSNLQGENHTHIKYDATNDSSTDTIRFEEFNIPADYYDKIILNLGGLCKVTNKFGINIECIQNNISTNKRVLQNSDIFYRNIDITDIVDNYVGDINIIISFDSVDDADEIYITSCSITTEKHSNTDNIKYTKMNDTAFNVEDLNSNYYLLTSNDIWTLKNQAPYFLSSEQLESNLVCYLDFGELKPSEYIKLYSIDMIVYYKTKYGKITTDNIISMNEDNTEYYITGQVNKNNGEFWTSVNDDDEGLNNLESEDLNVDEDGNIVNSIPLYKRLAQSFIYTNSSNISRITLGYDGHQGYPSDFINIYLYDDKDNNPNNIIFKSKIDMSVNKKGYISIDVDVNNLTSDEQYWIVIEDNNANINNYHKFTYNNNMNVYGFYDEENEKNPENNKIGTNNKVGNLIVEGFSGASLNDQQTLSFAIASLHNKAILYNLPAEFSDTYTENEYRISNIFYRFNTNSNNNVSLSNFTVKNGRYLNEDED